jgi:anti-sigma B factor antagonist
MSSPDEPSPSPTDRSDDSLPHFSLDVRGPAAGVTTVIPRGEIDLATVGELESWLEDLRIRCASVVLDLSQVTFIDSSGLRALARARAAADQAKTSLRLERPSPPVARALDLVGLDPQAGQAPDLRSAV